MIQQRLIFFDIDGTLLDRNKQLPPSAKDAIFRLKQQGHEVAIATGRAPFMFTDLRKELGIRTYISYNGQYVVLDDEILHTRPLEIKPLLALTESAMHRGHPVVFMDHEDMKANMPEHPHIRESIDTLKISHFPDYDPHYYKGRDLYQSLLFCPEGEEKPYEVEFREFDFVRWHPLSVDILPRGGSKAEGIRKIVDELGFPLENIYAFGDGLNDLEMLSTVHHSVAMGNALDEIKAAAKYVTKSADDDGIYHGLKLVGLL